MSETLSPALEDYLETVFRLCEENGAAKISEIAKRMNIAKPSVTQAMAVLRREGLVNQTPYGPITLTEKGQTRAAEVWRRHQIISRFLFEVLKVPPRVADKDACMIEHVISPETIYRMSDWLGEEYPPPKALPGVSLNTLQPGQKARIVKIQGQNSPVMRRILEMGLVPGVEIEMERTAPLGDPLELKIKDYHLSLRREEASFLIVNVVED